jgi:hypothetical protein
MPAAAVSLALHGCSGNAVARVYSHKQRVMAGRLCLATAHGRQRQVCHTCSINIRAKNNTSVSDGCGRLFTQLHVTWHAGTKHRSS